MPFLNPGHILNWEEVGCNQADLYLVEARSGDVSAEFANVATWEIQPTVQAGQIGPWYAVSPYGRQTFARIIESLTNDVANAGPGLVAE